MRPKGSWSREKKRKPPGWVKLLYLKSLLDFIGQNSWLGKAGVGCWHSACRWPNLSLPPALPSALLLPLGLGLIHIWECPLQSLTEGQGSRVSQESRPAGLLRPALCLASSPYRVILCTPTTTNQMALFQKPFLKNFELVWFWISNSGLLYCMFFTIIKQITYWKLIVLNMKRCSRIIREMQIKNYNEISPDTSQNGSHQNTHKQ